MATPINYKPDMDNPLLGEREINRLLSQALTFSSADETEIALSTQHEALTRFAHNVIHQNVAEVDAQVEVRAALGKRVGRAATNDLSLPGIECAVRRACDLTRHAPENPEWPGLPEPRPPTQTVLA